MREKKKTSTLCRVFNRIGTVCRVDIVCRIGIAYRTDSVYSLPVGVHQDVVVLHDLLRDLSYRNDNVWLNRLNLMVNSRIQSLRIDCQSKAKMKTSVIVT